MTTLARAYLKPSSPPLALAAMLVGLLLTAAPAGAAFEFAGEWGTEGSGPGQFQNPTGIATGTAGEIYVADYDNNRIQKFDLEGKFLDEWGGEGSEGGQFFGPWASRPMRQAMSTSSTATTTGSRSSTPKENSLRNGAPWGRNRGVQLPRPGSGRPERSAGDAFRQ